MLMDNQEKSQPNQLKIKGFEGKGKSQTDKPVKEKEKPGNKWVIVIILLVTVVAGLVFSISSKQEKAKFSLFGPAEYHFTK